MLISPVLDIYSVTSCDKNSISIPISITCDKEKKIVEAQALIDSGVGGMFIDPNYAKSSGFKIQKLNQPLTAQNVDGIANKKGKITSFVDFEIQIK